MTANLTWTSQWYRPKGQLRVETPNGNSTLQVFRLIEENIRQPKRGSELSSKFPSSSEYLDEVVENFLEELGAYSAPGELPRGNRLRQELELISVIAIYQDRYFSVAITEVLKKGREHQPDSRYTYRSVRWNSGQVAGGRVLFFDKDWNCLLVEVFRHAIRSWCLEPSGGNVRMTDIKGNLRLDDHYVAAVVEQARRDTGVQESANEVIHKLPAPYLADPGIATLKCELIIVTGAQIKADVQNTKAAKCSTTVILPNQKVWAAVNRSGVPGFLPALLLQGWSQGIIPGPDGTFMNAELQAALTTSSGQPWCR